MNRRAAFKAALSPYHARSYQGGLLKAHWSWRWLLSHSASRVIKRYLRNKELGLEPHTHI